MPTDPMKSNPRHGGARANAGRPRLPASKRRTTTVVGVRLDEEELGWLDSSTRPNEKRATAARRNLVERIRPTSNTEIDTDLEAIQEIADQEAAWHARAGAASLRAAAEHIRAAEEAIERQEAWDADVVPTVTMPAGGREEHIFPETWFLRMKDGVILRLTEPSEGTWEVEIAADPDGAYVGGGP